MFYILVLLLSLLLIYLVKSFKFNVVLTFLCSFLLLFVISYPQECITAALSGAKLFFFSVFPSLFSFLIIINIIISCGGIDIYSKLFGKLLCKPLRLPSSCSIVLIASLLCGYPMGAKYTVTLLDEDLIDIPIARKLLNIASNASPLFVIGAVGVSMLNNKYLGYLLLISNIISCFIMSYIYPTKTSYVACNSKQSYSKEENLGFIIKKSIEDALFTCLNIFGFVVTYSVLISIIKTVFLNNFLGSLPLAESLQNIINTFIIGIVEMTNGVHYTSTLSDNLLVKVVLISFFISFSGFSIISQVYSFTYKYKSLSMKKYVSFKFLQGVISALITYVLYILTFNKIIYTSSTVTSSNFSLNILMIVLSILLVPYIFYIIKNFSRNS